MRTAGAASPVLNLLVPDDQTPVPARLVLDGDIEFVEFVQVDAKIEAEFFRDLRLELESPSGAVSVLSVPAQSCREEQFSDLVSYCAASGRFRYGSARHLGEDPAGEWTLRVGDELGGGSGAEARVVEHHRLRSHRGRGRADAGLRRPRRTVPRRFLAAAGRHRGVGL